MEFSLKPDTVATLSDREIHTMERNELIQVIEAARIPFIDESRLSVQDTDTLQRLAFLSRQTSSTPE
tara:strand:+ start:873 stop:1073 length:201 start_codon:yes stop_codon:yes gene_type:complete